jgi:hypothetical protein
MSFIYVASPYTHADQTVQEERFRGVEAFVANLLSNKVWCYSPVVHCHELARRYNLPTTADFWYDYNRHMLEKAETLLVHPMPGWSESRGVQAEIALAESLGIPVIYRTEGLP